LPASVVTALSDPTRSTTPAGVLVSNMSPFASKAMPVGVKERASAVAPDAAPTGTPAKGVSFPLASALQTRPPKVAT
jgi:hypothetical protein